MLTDLVEKNRSYRGYNENYALTKEDLYNLIELARLCPSSRNGQPLVYLPVWEGEKLETLRGQVHWASLLAKQMTLPHPGKQPTAFIVICQDIEREADTAPYQRDVGAVAQTMLLGAVEKGLGGCMIANFSAPALSKALGLAERYVPQLVVALGKPDEKIVLTEVEDGKTAYYRDENDVHYVPKRKLSEIILS